MHTFEVKKGLPIKVQQIKREGSIKGEGGRYKKLKIPTLTPKSPRSGVTFHNLFMFVFTSLPIIHYVPFSCFFQHYFQDIYKLAPANIHVEIPCNVTYVTEGST